MLSHATSTPDQITLTCLKVQIKSITLFYAINILIIIGTIFFNSESSEKTIKTGMGVFNVKSNSTHTKINYLLYTCLFPCALACFIFPLFQRIKMESIRKLSSFNFQWTCMQKPCTRIYFNPYITFCFTLFKGYKWDKLYEKTPKKSFF